MGKNKSSSRNRNKRPKPLTVQPVMMKSRKKARKITSTFHKLMKDRDAAIERDDEEEIQKCDKLLEEMGGREEYQRASQLSTSFHSTSKWVLGGLARRGWLYGIPIDNDEDEDEDDNNTNNDDDDDKNNSKEENNTKGRKRKRQLRRPTRLLEVGAINTELLDAATRKQSDKRNEQKEGQQDMTKVERPNEEDSEEDNVNGRRQQQQERQSKYRLHVRAIDIRSVDERIEEADFLQFPLRHSTLSERYDVIVCSMVLNCVTTPKDRGKMLARLYHHLRPGGLCYLTIPKFCVTKSAFLTHKVFMQMLGNKDGGIGFHVEETKESPRVAFFVCRRPTINEEKQQQQHKPQVTDLNPKWKKQIIRNKGKKFPNQFSVILDDDEVSGRAIVNEFLSIRRGKKM